MLKGGPQNAEEVPQTFVELLLNHKESVLAVDCSSAPISHLSFFSK